MRPGEIVQDVPGSGGARPRAGARSSADITAGSGAGAGSGLDLGRIPMLRELEGMTTDQLDEVFGLKPTVDIPPAQQRSLERVGVLAPDEGGLPVYSLAGQTGRAGTRGLGRNEAAARLAMGPYPAFRRALASRLAAPDGMDPAEFAALRADLLGRMGEYEVAKALVQDVDTANYTPALTNAALGAYVNTSDILGACPAVRLGRSDRDDAEWAHAGRDL